MVTVVATLAGTRSEGPDRNAAAKVAVSDLETSRLSREKAQVSATIAAVGIPSRDSRPELPGWCSP